MKTQMNSKKTIIGLVIGAGLIAGLSVVLSGAQNRAFNPADTAKAVNAGMVIDESQEAGGNYPVSKITLPHELAFDESQENGSYGELRMTAPEFVHFDESQENGGT